MKKTLLVLMAAVLLFAGCKGKQAQVDETKQLDNQQKEESMASGTTWAEPKVSTVEADKNYIALIKTNKGEIVCDLFPKEAPLSVTNFKYLADGKFYDGLTFHRVVPEFVVQGGDPTGTGAGGPGYTIPAEINPVHKHVKGALAWARTGDEVNPERRSSGSQFYITLEPTPFLDGQYTVFGKVREGQDVVDAIRMGDVIETIEVRAE